MPSGKPQVGKPRQSTARHLTGLATIQQSGTYNPAQKLFEEILELECSVSEGYGTGTSSFSSSNQFNTTWISVAGSGSPPTSGSIKNAWPSRVTS